MKIPARFKSIKEIKKIFPKDLQVVGVGVSAFQRSGLGDILPNYQILSLMETNDLGAIRKKIPVTSIEKDLGGSWPEKLNTSSILKLPKVQTWLCHFASQPVRRARSFATPLDVSSGVSPDILRASVADDAKSLVNLFVYKAATPLDEILKTLPARLDSARQVKLLSSPGWVRKPLEDKKVFREEAAKAGIRIPRGENLAIKDLTEKKWDEFKQKYGGRLVFQLTDYSTGGGQGTFFVENKTDWQKFWEFVNSQERRKELRRVNVCERVAGRSASMTGCATRHGVVTGILQTQIMDQSELTGFKGRSGVWLGHDWNVRFSEKAQLNAEKLCQQWGKYIYEKGYKGIYGLDVIVTDRDEIVGIECNSRYTGAFPVYTMMQLSQGEIPLDVWHLAEWLGLDYEMDIKEVQKVSRLPKNGAHIILHNLEEKQVKAKKQVKAGVYRILARQIPARQRRRATCSIVASAYATACACRSASVCAGIPITYLRQGFSLMDIKSDNEFVLCDRVPNKGQTVKPGERIGKLMFKRRIIDDKGNLLPEIKDLVKGIYGEFGL